MPKTEKGIEIGVGNGQFGAPLGIKIGTEPSRKMGKIARQNRNSPLGKFYQERKAQSLFYRVATFYSTDEIVFYLRHAGFKDFNFSQTIFRSFTEIKTVESIREGYGEGSFVVIKAIKYGIVKIYIINLGIFKCKVFIKILRSFSLA